MNSLPYGKHQDVLIEPRKVLSHAKLEAALRQCGMKITRQRLAILQALNAGPRVHMTAQDILKETKNIGFATVYRFLKRLSKAGIVDEISMGNASCRYELKSKEFHYHVTCTRCGKIIEFKNKAIENSIKTLMKERGFILKHQSLELYVTCNLSGCAAAGS